jgi:alkylhydroperoxidase/carboxymuconolactone decarboxylase family protein YurZ
MSLHPLKIYEKLDPQLLKGIENSFEFTFSEGALPRKTKFLIAMALDASHGAIPGVKALAIAAKEAGATKDEILEAIRVAQYISGVGVAYVASHTLSEIF